MILIQNAKMKFVMTVLLIIEYGAELEHLYCKYFTKKCRYILYKNLFRGRVLCLFWSIAIDRSLAVLMKNTKLWQLMTSLCLNEQVIFKNTSQSRNCLSIKPCETMVWKLYGTKFTLTISSPFLMEFEKFQFHYNPLN